MSYKQATAAVLLFASSICGCYAQEIRNVKAAVEGDRIFITFDLSGAASEDKFDVTIWASNNNFSSPLRLVSGDIGNGVDAGAGKRIVWSAKSELGNYKGDLSFEVRAEIVSVFKQTTSLTSSKRGKSLPLTWRGGRKGEEVKIDLLKGGTLDHTVIATINDGTYEWAIPGDQKPGSDYQIRMVNGNETSTSDRFEIKHKVPTLLKVVPVVVVAAVAVLVGGSKSGTGDPTKESNLASPPDLGLN